MMQTKQYTVVIRCQEGFSHIDLCVKIDGETHSLVWPIDWKKDLRTTYYEACESLLNQLGLPSARLEDFWSPESFVMYLKYRLN